MIEGSGSGSRRPKNNHCVPQVPPQKRGRFLGPAGLNMRRLTADTGVQEPAKDRLMFLRFRFRLLTRYGSGSVSGSIYRYLGHKNANFSKKNWGKKSYLLT
jgi:hypothetical protein